MTQSKNLLKNKELGISIFPNRDSKDKIIKYIKLAYKFGFKRTFTNLIGLTKEELNNFVEICQEAKKIGMKMIIDIDKNVCDLFNVTLNDYDFFLNMGAFGIRLDVKFDASDISRLSYESDLHFEINASDFSGLDKELKDLDFDHKKIVASHNFFPQRFTGLSIEKFAIANKMYQDLGIKTSAFVTSNHKGAISAWEEAEGTPTLEIFRDMKIIDQIQFLLGRKDINYIIISDMYLTEEDFLNISKLEENNLILNILKNANLTENELEIINYDNHKTRGDNPDDLMIRSTISRKTFKDLSIVPKIKELEYFEKGSVLILNNNAGRYKGELHIIKEDLPYSVNKNLVGKIDEKQLHLLDIKNKVLSFKFWK